MKTHLLPRLVLLIGIACAGIGCATATAPAPTPQTPAPTPEAPVVNAPGVNSSAVLLAAIKEEIGDAACDSNAQCHSIGVGAKSCGGPEGYLAWSSTRSNEKTLRDLVARHAQARKDDNARSGMLSNCMAERDPGATCQAARCTIAPRGVTPPAGRVD